MNLLEKAKLELINRWVAKMNLTDSIEFGSEIDNLVELAKIQGQIDALKVASELHKKNFPDILGNHVHEPEGGC